jgi:hypothetical protein
MERSGRLALIGANTFMVAHRSAERNSDFSQTIEFG